LTPVNFYEEKTLLDLNIIFNVTVVMMGLREKIKNSLSPAFHISSLAVAETVLFEIFVQVNEVSNPFLRDVQACPSLYRFSLNLSDHTRKCKPGKENVSNFKNPWC
jgi:hypothetical protein